MQWSAGPWPGPPQADEVHVWKADLDGAAALVPQFQTLLAPGELARAERFHFERDRGRFIVGRAFLRTALGHYLTVDPAVPVFACNEFGKPGILGTDLRFNLSHSHGIALAAFTRGRDVGIDIEQVREAVMRDRIAGRFFSPGEAAAIAAVPVEENAEAFFRCWTRKEAWIKAVGHGLSIPLNSFDVTIGRADPRLAATRPDAAEAARWTMVHLDPEPGFVGAVAVEGNSFGISAWVWTGRSNNQR